MSGPREIVETFLAHFNAGRIDEAIDMLAEDVFYHNIPMEPINGRAAVRTFTHGFGVGSDFVAQWKTIAIAGCGNVVLTERLDEFVRADGARMSIPLMGSFRIRDGYIAEWRDYFDLGDFQRQFGALGDARDTVE
ncbi:limonene-1,2-epoxide hydrolase family protein [uncultured Sphingosinicella sp.]|mgnify:CR=1 FL=1|uniref:limonene-1,2-epoxide hydrolase family protein n=1 Tax=uncultured Sphingosinicella sp. TaxID=478748 RepID=UPI0030DA27EA|tara:strand:- start:46238 stop:46642 length:405 start_codon:yes stop_codon:yes gene_type:complete